MKKISVSCGFVLAGSAPNASVFGPDLGLMRGTRVPFRRTPPHPGTAAVRFGSRRMLDKYIVY